jgi:lipooligosaccharide transport system permease protein
MGIGLGSLVDERGGPGGISYLTWLAPGLLAAAAMQTAAGESSYPVMAGIKWQKTYAAALATPLVVRDLILGHLGWIGVRLFQVLFVYAGAIVVVGATDPVPALASIAPALLTGLAFAGIITAYTARLQNETGLSSLFRFGIVPLFLFSGTFFPISQLPGWIQPVAWFTPLWHGVELTRAMALGIRPSFAPAVHIGALVSVLIVGTVISVRFMERRIVS